MSVKILDGALFAEMLKSGAVNLRNNVRIVNELNVFPIPDGDTGENMARTVEGGAAAVTAGAKDISAAAAEAAHGMLLSARGNSGVILSQFFEGVRIGFSGKSVACVGDIKAAFSAGVEKAYSAVVAPTEGTILTVMRESCAAAEKTDNGAELKTYFTVLLDEMYASLDRTPELLPVLKESGVIDSGGAGLVYITEGMLRALTGGGVLPYADGAETAATVAADGADDFDENSDMKFGYCTELTVQLTNVKTDVKEYDVQTLIDYLNSMGGESIVAFKTGTRIKLHVHTFEPNKVIEYCLKVGELIAVKVENMSVQHTEAVVRNRFERRVEKKEKRKYACVAVADGAGIIEQFLSLGADYVVDGKQTMNPSAQDFISAFDEVDAQVVFVFPNNSNIIMTANQAAELYGKSEIVVINSKTLAEGYAALSMLDYSSDDTATIKAAFDTAVAEVETGLVTYSVRDCNIGGKNIKKGDWLGFAGKRLLSYSDDIYETSCRLLDGIDKTDRSIIIAVRGKEHADEALAARIGEYVAVKYPDMEFYEFDGGQDVYSFIFVVE